MLAALGDERWSGAGQRDGAGAGQQPRVLEAARPRARTARRCCRSRGSRCALLYGEMAEIVTSGARVVPAKPLCSATSSATRSSSEALRAALGR